MIVSFSGIDSAGKTTQINLLMSYLEKNNIKAKMLWSKARGTPGVVFLKEIVRKDKGMNFEEKAEHRKEVFQNPKKQKLLYIASMLDLCWYWGIYYRIMGAMNKFLICDRYIWDTYVEINEDFSCVDIDHSLLWKIVKKVSPKPKKSLVFIVPPEVSLERDIRKSGEGIAVDDIELKKSKIDRYLKCIDKSCWTNVMDGMKPIEVLHEEVKQILNLR